MVCVPCHPQSRKYWVFGCGTLFMSLALLLGLLWPVIVKKVLQYEMELRKGSFSYNNWIDIPIPMYVKFKMFNWTNPEDIHQPNYKPHLVEMGPYVFVEKHKRVNVSFHAENDTVQYNQIRTWHFMPEMSNGTLDDYVTNVNVIAASAAFSLREANTVMKMGADFLMQLKDVKLSVTKKVGELLYEGYDDPFLAFVHKLHLPNLPPFSKFGWFVDRNGSATYDGHFEMRSGVTDISKMGKLLEWNYEKKTRFYHGECSEVSSFTGELFPMNMDPTGDVAIFVTDLCRPLNLAYQQKHTRFGVTGSRWVGDHRTFDNGQNYAPNSCYCTGKSCPDLLSGVHNMSDCRFGAPIFASFPHFYLGDKYYVDSVTGLKPNQSEHEFSLSIEPNTGIPLDVNARIQINTLLQPIAGFKLYENISKVMIPAFWFTQNVELTEELAKTLKMVVSLPTFGDYFAIAFGSLSVILFIAGAVLIWLRRARNNYENLDDLTATGCLSCKPVSRKYWVFGCGTFFLISAITVGVVWPILTKNLLHEQLKLEFGSLGYENWVETPVPMYMKYIMFNWTNPQEIGSTNFKASFTEMGPYVFLEKHVRVNVTFHAENGTVSFDQIRTWHFMPDMSNGTLDDNVTNINVVATSASYTLRDANFLVKFAAVKLMRIMGVKLVVTKKVRELLFDGYEDAFLTALKKVPNLPNKPPFDKFGYFVDRNGSWTYDGHLEMYSGQDDITNMGILTNWNYVNKTRFQRDECSIVSGSTGEKWPMEMDPKADVSIFIMDFCRPIPLAYSNDYTHNGVVGSKWAVDYRAFDNGENYSPNSCYCTGKSCPDLYPGVQNMSDCRFGGPVFGSFPHFYLADDYYTDSISGMNPEKSRHEFYVVVEPNTGVPLKMSPRLQINILVQPVKGLKLFAKVPKLMIPAFWFEQTMELDDDKSWQAKIAAQLPSYGLYIALGISAVSAILLLCGIIFTFRKSWKVDKKRINK